MTKKRSFASTISPEFVLLGLLQNTPAHGYDLCQRLAENLGQFWHISLSQTYNILTRLETQGLIQGDVEEQEKLPSRRVFRLTPLGAQTFETWLHTPTPTSVRAIHLEFTSRLYFASLRETALVRSLIEAQVLETRTGLKHLEEISQTLPPAQKFNDIGLDLRISQLKAVLDWLKRCRENFREETQQDKTMIQIRNQRRPICG